MSILMPDDYYKIVLLGDISVGKTTFFMRVKVGNFVDTANLTTSIECHSAVVNVGPQEDCRAVKVLQFNC